MPSFAARCARTLRTALHLRPEQVASRLRYAARGALFERRGAAVAAALQRRAHAFGPARFDHPGLLRLAELRAGRVPAAERIAVARAAAEGTFTFLSRTEHFGERVAWQRPDLDRGTRLWKTLLHEFSYAIDLAVAARETGETVFRRRLFELLASWQEDAPLGCPGFRADSWNARAVANRAANLACAAALLRLGPDDPDAGRLGRLLAVHGLYLRDNLETDVRANHLLRDAVGLVLLDALLGCAPEARELLRHEVEEQVLPDGCHVERTPLYHAIALQDLVEMHVLLGGEAPPWLGGAVRRMAGHLAALLPEHSRLPLFGDTWDGEIEPRALLREALAEADLPEPPPPGACERHGGLVALRRGPLHVVVRAGPHGPDWQLGHAHADGLSVEISRGPFRVVSDSGTPTYDAGPARTRARSTAAHNTVEIDGHEQIEAWGSFRVGRRGRGRVLARGECEGRPWLWACHDGFRRLPGRPLHHRLVWLGEDVVLLLDVVSGAGRHRLRSFLHLHPEAAAAGARAAALGAVATCAAASLHERFNETREMAELHFAMETTLPWAGGWLVRCDGGPLDAELHLDDDSVTARWAGAAGPLALRWDALARPRREAVRLCRAPAGRATKEAGPRIGSADDAEAAGSQSRLRS